MPKKRPTIENVTLFVLVGSREKREVRRAPLTQALQEELSEHFATRYDVEFAESHKVLDYTPGYKADKHEVSEISPFKLPSALAEAMKDPTSPSVITTAEIEAGARVLVAYDPESGLALFQHLDARTVIHRGFSIVLSREHFKRQDAAGLVIRDQIHAAVLGSSLTFQSFYFASQIFELTDWFESASNEQVDEFLGHESLAPVKPDLFKGALDTWSRRKIRSIQTSAHLDTVTPAVWKAAAAKCGLVLQFTSGRNPKIVLPTTKKELREVLRLLDDDYLDSIVNEGTTFQVSSKRKVRG